MIKIKFKEIFSLLVVLIILITVFSFNIGENNFQQIKVDAGEEHNLSGYAWSENIGWISFNCLDEDTCGIVNYGVSLESDNDLSGYAWSENIGWISFNESDLINCPKGACKAKIVGENMEGWARVLENGNGWDGWISLSTQPGGSINYGVTLNDSEFSGYAWGSDVVGWINFEPVNYGGVLLDAFSPPTITQFNVENVVNGDTPNINWTTEYVDRCTGSWTQGNLCSNQANCASGSDIGDPVNSETTYVLTCEGSQEVSESRTPSPYYNLGFVDGYSNIVKVNFVVSGATTTKTKIKITPWNGFVDTVTLDTEVDSATPEALPNGSYGVYSDRILTSFEYEEGSELSIWVEDPITGTHTVPISGNGGILNGVDVIINAKGVAPKFEEI